MHAPESTPSGLDQPWLAALRTAATGVLAFLTMVVSMLVVFVAPYEAPNTTTRTTLFGPTAVAPESRLTQQPVAWVHIGAFGVTLAAFATRLFAEGRQRAIESEMGRRSIFPPPRQSRWRKRRPATAARQASDGHGRG